jgi:hypothetical protein
MSILNPNPTIKPPLGSYINRAHPLAESIDACWLMNEGCGGKIIDIANNNHGTIATHNNQKWTPADAGIATEYNGSDKGYNCGSKVTRPQSGYVATWMFQAQFFGSADTPDQKTLGAFRDGSGNRLILQERGGDLRVQLSDSLFPSVGLSISFNSTYNYAAVFDYDNSSIIGYKTKPNYYETSSITAALNTVNAGTDFTIGNQDYYDEYYGLIFRAYLFNRKLSQYEIEWLTDEPYCFIVWPSQRLFFDFGSIASTTTTGIYYRTLLQG